MATSGGGYFISVGPASHKSAARASVGSQQPSALGSAGPPARPILPLPCHISFWGPGAIERMPAPVCLRPHTSAQGRLEGVPQQKLNLDGSRLRRSCHRSTRRHVQFQSDLLPETKAALRVPTLSLPPPLCTDDGLDHKIRHNPMEECVILKGDQSLKEGEGVISGELHSSSSWPTRRSSCLERFSYLLRLLASTLTSCRFWAHGSNTARPQRSVESYLLESYAFPEPPLLPWRCTVSLLHLQCMVFARRLPNTDFRVLHSPLPLSLRSRHLSGCVHEQELGSVPFPLPYFLAADLVLPTLLSLCTDLR